MRAKRAVVLPVIFGAVAVAAHAQAFSPLTCSASAGTAPVIRGESVTELTADVLVTCTGGFPTYPGYTIPPVMFQITLNANVTSRLLAPAWSEALLLLDEPPPTTQYPCDSADGICTAYGNGTGSGYYGGGAQSVELPNNRNVFQGQAGSDANTVLWPSVPLDPPGTTRKRVFRFTNIRVDASSLKNNPIQATITAFAFDGDVPYPFPIGNNTLVLGTPQLSLSGSVRDPSDSVAEANGSTVTLGQAANVNRYAYLRFSELLPLADKPRTAAAFVSPDVSPPPVNQNVPGTVYNTETGFFNSAFGTYGARGNLGLAGLADSGTRFIAYFTNIPAGFNIYVDLYNTTASGGPTARLVSTDPFGTGPFSPVPGTNVAQLPVNNGTAVAVWEVLQRTSRAADQFDFGVYLSFPAIISATAPGPIGVQMRYAPVSGGASVIPLFSGSATRQTLVAFLPVPPQLTVTPTALTFTATAGGNAPKPQSISVDTDTGVALGFNVSNAPNQYITVTPPGAVTPAKIAVGVNWPTGGLPAGVYNTYFNVNGTQGGGSVLVPVAINVGPGPRIIGVSPASVTAGAPAFVLTVSGVNFPTSSSVLWNGAALPTTFVNSGHVTAQVAASLIASAGTASVSLATGDGAVSNAVPVTITAATAPLTISQLTPSTVSAGGPAFSLAVTGSGFAQGATVSVGGTTLQPTAATATQLTVTVAAAAIAQAGTVPVFVTNPNGQVSNTLTLTVTAPLHITAIGPSAVTAGGPAFTLTISGSGFASGATVSVGGSTLQAGSVSPTQITVSVPAAAIATAGALPVSVTNPAGATSNSVTLTVNAGPAITSVSPDTVTPGSAAFTLTVTGTNFPNGASVRWNGQALATTFGSATQLTAQVPASLVAAAGTAAITVATADGAVSNAVTVTVALPPLPGVSFTAPSSANSGQDQNISVALGGSYPVDLQGTLTLTFAGDSGLPDDPAIQFQNGKRTFTFTVPAGTQAQTQVVVKTGTVAGVITITPSFTAAGADVTPAGITTQRIVVGRAAPSISLASCTRSASGFTVVVDGFTNTRSATQATFDFQAAPGANLGTTELTIDVGSIFNGWFGSTASSGAGGLFSYSQAFNVQGSATGISSVSVKLANATGASAAATCQLQ